MAVAFLCRPVPKRLLRELPGTRFVNAPRRLLNAFTYQDAMGVIKKPRNVAPVRAGGAVRHMSQPEAYKRAQVSRIRTGAEICSGNHGKDYPKTCPTEAFPEVASVTNLCDTCQVV